MSGTPQIQYDLRIGFPHPDVFPREQLAALMTELTQRDEALQYTYDRAGDPWTREQLAAWLTQHTGHTIRGVELQITTGAIPGIDQVARYVTKAGDLALVENPTFYYIIDKLKLNHVDVMGVPMQPDGIDLNVLEDICKQHGERLSILYAIPTFNNPTGYTYSDEKRRALVALAQKYNFTIVEDVTYQMLYYSAAAAPPPMIREYDTESGHVITVGSFSKLVMPALRTGWVWTTEQQAKELPFYKTAVTSAFMSQVVGTMIERGQMDTQMQRSRQFYGDKYRLMVKTLKETAPDWFTFGEPNGGYFLWATLPDSVTASAVMTEANRRGVSFLPGRLAHVDGDAPDNTLRLCYTLQPDDALVKATGILSECLHEIPVRA